MLQNIITLVIVYSTLAWAVYSVFINLKNKKTSKCSGCGASCGLKNYNKSDTKRSLPEAKQINNEDVRKSAKHLTVAQT